MLGVFAIARIAVSLVPGLTTLVIRVAPGVVLIASIFCFSSGMSLVTALKEGLRARLLWLPLAPKSTTRLLLSLLLIYALAVMGLILALLWIPYIAFLIAAGVSLHRVLLFALLSLLVLLAFTYLGCGLALLWLRVAMKRGVRIVSALVGVPIALLIVPLEMNPSAAVGALLAVSSAISSLASPFYWPARALTSDVPVVESLASAAFALVIIPAVARWLTGYVLAGKLQLAPPKIRAPFKLSLLARLFRPPLRGLLHKEIATMKRHPDLLMMLLLPPVIVIPMLLVMLQQVSARAPIVVLSGLSTLVMVVAVLSVGYINVSYALEGRGKLANILMSPADLRAFVVSKVVPPLISSILTLIVAHVVVVVLAHIPLLVALLALLAFIGFVLIVLGVGSIVSFKWTDLKAKNPRRAMKTAGSIVLVGLIFATMIVCAVFSVLCLNDITALSVASPAMLLAGVLVLRYSVSLSARIVAGVQATEYM